MAFKEVGIMPLTNVNISIDSEIDTRARQIFATLGLDMTTAINLFLRQTVYTQDIPFSLSANQMPIESVGNLPFGRGCMRGKMQIAENFDEPLKDFQEYME
jgi:DNA-damage-inducible protein J